MSHSLLSIKIESVTNGYILTNLLEDEKSDLGFDNRTVFESKGDLILALSNRLV